MHREVKCQVKRQSRVGNLLGEMPIVREHHETSTPTLSPDRKCLQVCSGRNSTTPPPPKARKAVIPYTIALRNKVSNIPFPQSPALVSIVKAKILFSVPSLGDLRHPDVYQQSRAQAA